MSKITLKPSADSELYQTPYVNGDNFVDFRDDDVENPTNWSLTRKRYITAMVVILSSNGSIASSITAGSTQSIRDEFGISNVTVQLTTSVFLLGFCAGPLIFAPLSEFYGRRWMLYTTFFLYVCFTYLAAWSPNFEGLLVGRFLAGAFAAGPLAITSGVLVDLWDRGECGNAMGILICTSWIGPALGTVISGFFQLKKDWHWGMYACLWLGSFSMTLMFTIPETHGSTILVQTAKRARQHGHDVQAEAEVSSPKLLQLYKIALTRPWVLLFDTICFLCCLYSCVISALQYMLFTIYPLVFRDMRGWNAGVSQLPILGHAIGLVIMFGHTKRRKNKEDMGRDMLPEDHMVLAMIGGVGFPISMLWLSWSAHNHDTYGDYAASAVAVNIVARCLSSAGSPLFTTQMFNVMGIGGGGSLIAGVAALLAITPFLFYRYGHIIRSKSKYALD
ncbi:major facilitator superfamily domain-containing protein [Fusarium acuminatum]|uniref:Major facilitator superfamily domain-containing protein n=1 Tax=Fusarium acuminatum TaxID=5515 RepID=A0ABZ2WWC3_9HYPO